MTAQHHAAAIHFVTAHIDSHLDSRLSVQQLADLAGYSKYYFHHLFQRMIGENVNEYVLRLRLQKARRLLAFQPEMTLTDVAFECGFQSLTHFSRTFAQKVGMNPSHYRKRIAAYQPFDESTGTKWLSRFPIELREIPSYSVAYIRRTDGYDPNKPSDVISGAFHLLREWLEARYPGERRMAIGIPLDDPYMTPVQKCRYDACYTCSPDVAGEGIVSTKRIGGGLYAVAHIQTDDFRVFWDFTHIMHVYWLSASKFQYDLRPHLEIYRPLDSCSDIRYAIDVHYCLPVRLR